ncbi:hypothetical protein FACS189429_2990 [Bacteroidia bacterium]|nr:hypothetical protein FACS189429_2990 [Bacteroidia bacterium]GHV45804.1 hypothetical protein FACS1894180_8560 [Bacteroidia bacterium]
MSEFEKALKFCKDNNLYLGEGNPDAKILLVGKDPGFSREDKENYTIIGNN